MRVVRSPAREVAIDSSGRTAGRGAYVCRAAECIDTAIKKGAIGRALRTPLPPDLRAALIAGIADPANTSIEGGARGQE
jgi:predicted RNA-binding protein YlxR (DUF448 family)